MPRLPIIYVGPVKTKKETVKAWRRRRGGECTPKEGTEPTEICWGVKGHGVKAREGTGGREKGRGNGNGMGRGEEKAPMEGREGQGMRCRHVEWRTLGMTGRFQTDRLSCSVFHQEGNDVIAVFVTWAVGGEVEPAPTLY